MKNTLQEIRDKISSDSNISDTRKEELLGLLDELNSEIGNISSFEHADKIAVNVMRTTEEVTKEDKDPDLIEKAIGDLKDSVTEFEVSHPKLFEKVNNISAMLASMGI